MDLSDRMKTEAVSLGLCAQWTADWRDKSNKHEMVEKFINGIDFCIKHDWPSCDVIKRDFGDVIHEHGVYVDETVHLRNPRSIVVLNGHCDATITFDGYAVATVYVRHDSRVSINVKDLAKIRVCAYDKSKVSINCVGHGRCTAFRYGGDVYGNAKIIERLGFVVK